MAFMSRYRKLMQTNAKYLPPAQIMEEVDYNFGRAFQSLGKSSIPGLSKQQKLTDNDQVSYLWLSNIIVKPLSPLVRE